MQTSFESEVNDNKQIFDNTKLIFEYGTKSVDLSYKENFLFTGELFINNLHKKEKVKSLGLFRNSEFLLTLNYDFYDNLSAKYYPSSEELITISSSKGLDVLDLNKEEIIYNYAEELKEHEFLKSEIFECPLIIGRTENNLKIFDLRSRQSIFTLNLNTKNYQNNQISQNSIKCFDNFSYFLVSSGESIFKVKSTDLLKNNKNLKNDKKIVELSKSLSFNDKNESRFVDKFITDFQVYKSRVTYIFEENREKFFVCDDLFMQTEHEKLFEFKNKLFLYNSKEVKEFKKKNFRDVEIILNKKNQTKKQKKDFRMKEFVVFDDKLVLLANDSVYLIEH